MIITLFCRTPMAGAIYQQWECLKKYTGHDVRMITERNVYPDGRVFPYDISYRENKDEAICRIRNSDILHLHNYIPGYLKSITDKKKTKVIATLHSVPRLASWKELTDFAHKSFVIRQPRQEREYSGFNTLPNLFDIYSMKHSNKITDKIVICYAPSNRRTTGYPGSKGYIEVMGILQRVRAVCSNVVIDIVEKIPYLENLKRKQQCHILVDDVVPGHSTFHLTSLEGSALGKCVITGVGEEEGYPFIKANFNSLAVTLNKLIDNPIEIEKIGEKSRKWVEDYWDPKKQVKEYLNVYEN